VIIANRQLQSNFARADEMIAEKGKIASPLRLSVRVVKVNPAWQRIARLIHNRDLYIAVVCSRKTAHADGENQHQDHCRETHATILLSPITYLDHDTGTIPSRL